MGEAGLYNLVSFAGIFALMGVAWLLSADRKVIHWRAVLWGTALQLLFALFIFVVPAGAKVFLFVNDVVVRVLDSASAGTRFVFGRLAIPPGMRGEAGEESLGFILAFQGLPTIIFFSSLMGALYYAGVMPRLIRFFAGVFSRTLRISGAESLSVSSNIFVGVEANMTVLPHLGGMTRSEFCTILAAGMATTASNVLALYVFLLQRQFPAIAGHLVSASILSAVSAVVLSKLILPETDEPATFGVDVSPHYEKESSLMEAIIKGANEGAKMIVGIVALLLAFLGIVALADLVLGEIGTRINLLTGLSVDWSLKGLLGYLFYPLTLVIGVPFEDAAEVSRLIGERTILTEVKAYQDLAVALAAGAIHSPRSAVIAAYALCGFAHVASLAIFVGGTAALVPQPAPGTSPRSARARWRPPRSPAS